MGIVRYLLLQTAFDTLGYMKIFNTDSSKSLVFTKDEMDAINDIRKEYEDCTDREKFILKQALLPYFENKKT